MLSGTTEFLFFFVFFFSLSPGTLYGYLIKHSEHYYIIINIINIIIIIIEILDIIFIIVLRVSLLLIIWSSVNIVFYLFRYYYFFVVYAACRTTRLVPMNDVHK